MNPNQFQSSAAGTLQKIGKGNTAYWAFIPAPLPPTLQFDTDLVRTLSGADRALGKLSGLGSTSSSNILFVRPFIRREAILSSRIEGTRTDLSTLYAYEAGQLYLPGFTPNAPEADTREVYNYVTALEYGLKRLNTLPVSLRLTKELHTRLMDGVRGGQATPGQFRHSQNWIGEPNCTLNEATFVPPPVPQMHEALNDWEMYIHTDDDLPPLVRLALIHYQFEAIHPFLDGNGRIGRLLNALLLVNWDLLPIPLLYLSAYFEENRTRYYELLTAVSQHGAWHEWILFFLRGVIEQAADANHRAQDLYNLQNQWQKTLRVARSTSLMSSVVNVLFEMPFQSAKDIRQRFNVSHQTAIKTLRKLESLEILKEVTGKNRNQLFLASSILQILT